MDVHGDEVIVTSRDASRFKKLYRNVDEGLNILWGRFHECSICGFGIMEGGTMTTPAQKAHG